MHASRADAKGKLISALCVLCTFTLLSIYFPRYGARRTREITKTKVVNYYLRLLFFSVWRTFLRQSVSHRFLGCARVDEPASRLDNFWFRLHAIYVNILHKSACRFRHSYSRFAFVVFGAVREARRRHLRRSSRAGEISPQRNHSPRAFTSTLTAA